MIVNSDITVFNKRYDRAERTERFYGTQIRGVSFYSRKGTSSGSKELSKSDAYTIRIPAAVSYTHLDVYKRQHG